MAGKSKSEGVCPRHLVHRARDNQTCFYTEGDYQYYLECLKERSIVRRIAIHAYVLMANHVHLLISAASDEAGAELLEDLRLRHDVYGRRIYGYSASTWQDDYWVSPVASDDNVLICYRYIEQNPVRAALVKYAIRYRWSSFAYNAMGYPNALVSPQAAYLNLAATRSLRQQAYRDLFRRRVCGVQLDKVRLALNNEPVHREIGPAAEHGGSERRADFGAFS